MSLEGTRNDEGDRRNNLYHDESKTPVSIVINKELANALEEALVDLPEKYRVVFVMREMECMSIAETRDALDISESNVKVRVNRAKAILRSNLTEYNRSDSIFHVYLTRCNRVLRNVITRNLAE